MALPIGHDEPYVIPVNEFGTTFICYDKGNALDFEYMGNCEGFTNVIGNVAEKLLVTPDLPIRLLNR